MVEAAPVTSVRPDWSEQRARSCLALAVLLGAAYALPLFAPPVGAPPAPLAADAPLLERLFPGVPAWWVMGRLSSLAAAMVLVMWVRPGIPALRETPRGTVEADDSGVSPRRVQVALYAAAVQAVVGLGASYFGRLAQVLYVAWLAVPPLVLTRWRRLPGAFRLRDWRGPAVVGGLVSLWLLLRVPAAWRSPRAADLLDMWIGLRFLKQSFEPGFNLLTDRFLPGSGSLFVMFEGAGLAPLVGIRPSFQVLQAVQFLWLTVAGCAVGWLAVRRCGVAAASVATTGFLFSPFVSMMLLSPLPLFIGPLLTGLLLLLLVKVQDQRSVAALAALGALSGIGATLNVVSLVSSFIFAAGLWSAWHAPRLPRRGLIIASLLYAAVVVTAFSDMRAIPSLARRYSSGNAEWVGHEMAGFGQISPRASAYVVEAAIPRRCATALSAALVPFAAPRTPLRLVGDALFDPVGSSLGAIGIAISLGAIATSSFARLLLGILALGVLPGIVSSQDRISFIRFVSMPVVMALFAGIGWDAVRRWLIPVRWSTVGTVVATAAIAIGGVSMFDRVNPRILPASWTGLALSALADGVPPGGAVFLDHPTPRSFPYWYLNEIMEGVPAQPIAVREYRGPDSLRTGSADGIPIAELLVWNPGLEEDQQVFHALCRQWPQSALYILVDQAHRARAFAARPNGPGWKPALGRGQWQVTACGAVLETEATWAAEAVRQGRALSAEGRQQEAVALLRAAARRNFAQAGLFEAAAQAILGIAADTEQAQEAVQWARRACQVTQFRDPSAMATLADSLAATGRAPEAIAAAQQARALALAQGNEDLVAQLDRRLREYEARSAGGRGE
jgi:hypothetical protein